MQVDPLLHMIFQAVCAVLFHKELRPGKTEAVNALLYIPYHEDIVSALRHPGHTGQDGLLHQVAVLVLIDHDLLKPLLIFPRGRRGHQFPVFFHGKDLQRELLHIAEVDHIPAPLLFSKQLCKTVHQTCERPHGRAGPPHVLLPLFAGHIEIQLADVLYQLFCLLAHFFYSFLFLIGHGLVLFPGHAFPGVPADHVILNVKRFRPFQPRRIFQIRLDHIPVHIRSVRLFTDLQGMLQQFPDISRPAAYPLCGAVRQFPAPGRLICLHTGSQPFFRLRITSGILVELQDDLLDLTVISPGPEPLHKIKELFCPFVIACFQQLIQHVLAQEPELAFLRDAESGVNADDMEMIPDHGEAEAVDRRDGGAVDQGRLLLQPCVPGAFPELVLDRGPDPLFHLRCRCLRKCHDEQAVHIHGMRFLCEPPDDPLHEHRRLAGTCCR